MKQNDKIKNPWGKNQGLHISSTRIKMGIFS